ncbi:MAG: hypothetical protein HYZ53_02515 [Planctomycetes bacterium]|nr:hypothetical protein [Planctomycetota bacterium]
MRKLSGVLAVKLAVTTLLWFAPLLLLPLDCLRAIGIPDSSPPLFLRLLGMAYLSLCVGYAFGLVATLQGRYPRSTVWTGIVSNGGAVVLLSIGAFQGAWETWGFYARVMMWTSLVFTGLISMGLIAFGPCGRHSPGGQGVAG